MSCEVKESCKNEAIYSMYRINEDLSKDWLDVCKECEAEIGDNNMRLQGFNPRSGKLLEVKLERNKV